MKKILALIMALCMVLSLCAIASADAEEEYNISVILKTTASEYWGYVQAGAMAYMEEHPNVTVKVTGPSSETAFDEQQNMIETALNDADVDAYIIAPLQSDTVVNLIAGQEKPIIAVDTNITVDGELAPEVLSFVGTGNEEAAKLGGEAAYKLAEERGWETIECVEIEGVQGDPTNEARKAGYKAGVEEAGGTFLDESYPANAVADQAVTCMEAIMQAHPDGIAIVCANNDDMAAAAARTAAGNDAFKDTVFLGFDGTQGACNSILDGEETMSVAQQPYEMGYKAVEAAVAALSGEELEEFIDSGAGIVDPDTAQERLEQLQGYLGEGEEEAK